MDTNVLIIGFAFSETVGSALCPSGKKKIVTIRMRNTIIASPIKTALQPSAVAIKPPSVGASNGESPITRINNEKIRALCVAERNLDHARPNPSTQPPGLDETQYDKARTFALCAPMHVTTQ